MKIDKPESEWFRAPMHFEMGRTGDQRRFMWIAEPELRKGIFGVAYAISGQMEFELSFGDLYKLAEMAKEATKNELYRCIEGDETHPEGSSWDAFQKNLVIVRDSQTYELVEVKVEKIPHDCFPSNEIEVRNLYTRPGRFIGVDGPVDDSVGDVPPDSQG